VVHRSAPELLALHGVRILGSATPGEVHEDVLATLGVER
jgi:hypothetical protein